MCHHEPACPEASASNCCSAHVTADHMEQGWCRLCNGVILFNDGSFLAPDGHVESIPAVA